MSPAHLLRRYWLVAIAVVFFISGAIFRAQAATPLILSPTPNSIIYGSEVTINFTTGNIQLVDYKLHPKPVINQGHLLLWLDQTSFPVDSAIKIITPNFTFANLKSGPHSLVVELVSNDHASLNPPVKAVLSFRTAPPLAPQNPSLISSSVFQLTALTVVLLIIALYVTNLHLKTLKTSKSSKPAHKKSKTSK